MASPLLHRPTRPAAARLRPARRAAPRFAAAAALAAVGALAGCGSGGGSSSVGAGAATTSLASQPAISGQPLPSFKATAQDGTAIEGRQIKGPALIHVYASWCPTCKAEAPDFAKFLKANPSIKPIYVAVADKPALSKAFLPAHGWRSGPIIDDPSRKLATSLGLRNQPNTIFIGADGRTKVLIGGGSQAALQAAADAA